LDCLARFAVGEFVVTLIWCGYRLYVVVALRCVIYTLVRLRYVGWTLRYLYVYVVVALRLLEHPVPVAVARVVAHLPNTRCWTHLAGGLPGACPAPGLRLLDVVALICSCRFCAFVGLLVPSWIVTPVGFPWLGPQVTLPHLWFFPHGPLPTYIGPHTHTHSYTHCPIHTFAPHFGLYLWLRWFTTFPHVPLVGYLWLHTRLCPLFTWVVAVTVVPSWIYTTLCPLRCGLPVWCVVTFGCPARFTVASFWTLGWLVGLHSCPTHTLALALTFGFTDYMHLDWITFGLGCYPHTDLDLDARYTIYITQFTHPSHTPYPLVPLPTPHTPHTVVTHLQLPLPLYHTQFPHLVGYFGYLDLVLGYTHYRFLVALWLVVDLRCYVVTLLLLLLLLLTPLRYLGYVVGPRCLTHAFVFALVPLERCR